MVLFATEEGECVGERALMHIYVQSIAPMMFVCQVAALTSGRYAAARSVAV